MPRMRSEYPPPATHFFPLQDERKKYKQRRRWHRGKNREAGKEEKKVEITTKD